MPDSAEVRQKLEAVQAQIAELRMQQAEIGARLARLEGEFFMLKRELTIDDQDVRKAGSSTGTPKPSD